MTTLRNVIGSLDLEQTLTSRDQINGQLRGVLDEATGSWGIRVNRVELKAIDPPHSVQDSMEKQMRAERDRRAAILTAEGVKQSAILTAEGEKQSQILRAEGSAQARILEAQGQAQAITAGLRGDPPRQARPEAARLPVPPGAAADRARRLQQDLDRPERAHRGPRGHRQRPRRHRPGRPGGGGGRLGRHRRAHADAFDDTVLEDPARALAEAREEAARSSAEAEGHSAGVSGRVDAPSVAGHGRRRPDGAAGAARGPAGHRRRAAGAAGAATDLPLGRPGPRATPRGRRADVARSLLQDTRSPSLG